MTPGGAIPRTTPGWPTVATPLWAINRAHWLAGRYVRLHGPEPAAIVIPPSWEEVADELGREVEHLERHLLKGDTDPYEATYALLNGSRILHALETQDVAISKRAAGAWALERLPARWHPALQAAVRTYDGHPSAGDADLLAAEMGPFVALVRERLPYAGIAPRIRFPAGRATDPSIQVRHANAA